MLEKSRRELSIYSGLYILVFVLLALPWAYFDASDERALKYNFLPRQVILVSLAILSATLVYLKSRITKNKIIKGTVFFALGILHIFINRYEEPHFFYQFIYLEVALLFVFAPKSVLKTMLAISPYILYLLVAKGFFLRMGGYIHGGFFSSNLYATYILYLSFVEVSARRYWNLIPALCILYFVGSKAVYLSMCVLFLAVIFEKLIYSDYFRNKLPTFKLYLQKKFNVYWSIGVAVVSVVALTAIMIRTDYYKNWSQKMAPSKVETTRNNMIMYGMDKSKEGQLLKGQFIGIVEDQYYKRELEVNPLITDVGMSLGLRLTQYEHIYFDLKHYLFVGNSVYAQEQMYGHNPHSAVPDFISRLGVLYLVLVLYFYRRLFRFMNVWTINVALIPILAFQPYGFTLGHSIVILTALYSLAAHARESKLIVSDRSNA